MTYDHHTVWIEGRKALLLTYPWALEDRTGTLDFVVSFTYAAGHPSAPSDVQAVVDRLRFRPIEHR